MPKMAKPVWNLGTSKRKISRSSRVTIIGPGLRRIRSSLVHIDIHYDLIMDESGPRPIDLDKDIVDQFKPFTIVDISEPTRPIDVDIYSLEGWSR